MKKSIDLSRILVLALLGLMFSGPTTGMDQAQGPIFLADVRQTGFRRADHGKFSHLSLATFLGSAEAALSKFNSAITGLLLRSDSGGTPRSFDALFPSEKLSIKQVLDQVKETDIEGSRHMRSTMTPDIFREVILADAFDSTDQDGMRPTVNMDKIQRFSTSSPPYQPAIVAASSPA